jgi:arsenite methyltransferase
MSAQPNNTEELKEIVRRKYAEISTQGADYNARSCCGAGGASTKVYNIMTDDYLAVEGYSAEADLGLGCGLPTQFAQIKPGNTVIDLGSGAGNDCFVARHETGPEGRVIGIDFTQEMIKRARINAEKLGYNNVEFRHGDIEALPVSDEISDVVVSNCVLNLVPDKATVFAEIFRVLKPGGHFSISDIVLEGELPSALKNDAEMYAGCVAGAIQKTEYLSHITKAGFDEIIIQKQKPIEIPEDVLQLYLDETEIARFNRGGTGIYSITVFAEKPADAGQTLPKSDNDTSETHEKSSCCQSSGCC